MAPRTTRTHRHRPIVNPTRPALAPARHDISTSQARSRGGGAAERWRMQETTSRVQVAAVVAVVGLQAVEVAVDLVGVVGVEVEVSGGRSGQRW